MQRHAKASSAGSNTRQARGLGRAIRGAFAIRGGFGGAKGSGAPSRRLLGLLALAAIVLLAFAATASAANVEAGSFAGGGPDAGGSGSEDGQLANPGQAEVNDSNNKLYVADTGNDRVEVFSLSGASGAYDSQAALPGASGLAIDQSSGDLYVASATGIAKLDASLAPAVGWSDPGVTGNLAVDPSSGDLLVADTAANLIRRFNSDGTPAGSFAAERPIDLAANSSGDVFVLTSTGDITASCGPTSAVKRFSSAGVEGATVGASLEYPGAVAVDPDDDSILIAAYVNTYFCEAGSHLPEIAYFDSGGAFLESTLLHGQGNESLNSMVPGLSAAGAGSTRAYALTKSPASDSFGSTRVAVLDDLAPPVATIAAADGLGFFAATVHGTVNPEGNPTACHFEYSTDTSFDQSIPCVEDPGAATSPVAVHADLTGLANATAYNFRLLATSAGGALSDTSAEESFTTATAVSPTIEPVDPDTLTATAAQLSGTVDPNGVSTQWHFEYRIVGAPSWTTTPAQDAGSGAIAIPVSYELAGLAPNAEYEARLVATNAGDTYASAPSPIFTTDTAAPIVTTAASVASEEDATLHGLIDPQGSNVATCRFEWGTSPAYGNTVPCASLPGAGQGPKLVTAQLHGLDPHTTYYFRLTATSAAGSSQGPARSLATGPGLPDHRAWEMVSPPEKNGGGIIPMGAHTSAAQELAPGEPMALAYNSLVGFGDTRGGGVAFDYLAVRDAAAGRWETHAITPEGDPRSIFDSFVGTQSVYQPELSPDLSRGVTLLTPNRVPFTPDSVPVQKVFNLYLRSDLRDPGPGSYQLVTGCPLCLQSEPPTSLTRVPQSRPWFAAASHDFSHVAFDSLNQLTSDANPLPVFKAYEWANGQVRLIGRVPVSGNSCDDQAGPACEPAPSSEIGRGIKQFRADSVSTDGSRILFMAPGDSSEQKSQYYMRIGDHASVRINASEKPGAGTPQPAELWKSTPDLSHVFFTTSEQLIPSDEDICSDLYRYDVDPLRADGLPDPGASHLTRISVDHEPADGVCAVAAGAIGTSTDGDTVYFIAAHQLVRGAPSAVGPVVYRWHDGALRYIGQLADENFDAVPDLGASGVIGDITASISPDGAHLLFSSASGAHLTGYQHGDCNSAFDCLELYLYSADADNGKGELACVSCNPSGTASPFRPSFELGASFRSDHFNGGVDNITAHIPHPLSADGRFAFFDSGERLVPEDENNQRDVYRYDSQSGQLSLLSSGAEDAAGGSFFLDAAADGTDAFFGTADQLSGWDVDHAYDAYDARLGGGLPEPPAILPSCIGDACQPPPGQLNDPTPSSSSFSGAGNAREGKAKARCAKGKRAVKARGKKRCVKAKKHKAKSKRDANSNRRASR